jgi:hypothetical protein
MVSSQRQGERAGVDRVGCSGELSHRGRALSSREKELKAKPGHIVYKRFKSAAAAIRFAIEELPSSLLAAAALEVGDHRYDAQQIRKLYDASAYPLKRHSRR